MLNCWSLFNVCFLCPVLLTSCCSHYFHHDGRSKWENKLQIQDTWTKTRQCVSVCWYHFKMFDHEILSRNTVPPSRIPKFIYTKFMFDVGLQMQWEWMCGIPVSSVPSNCMVSMIGVWCGQVESGIARKWEELGHMDN